MQSFRNPSCVSSVSSAPLPAVSPEYQILCRQFRDNLQETNKTTANTSNTTLANTTDGVKEVLSETDLKKDELESENSDTSHDLTTLFNEVGISNSTVSVQANASDSESELFLYELSGLFDQSETETGVPESDLLLHKLSELFDEPDSPDETQGSKENNSLDKPDYLHGLFGDSDSDEDLGFGLFDDDKWTNPKHQTTQQHIKSVTEEHCSDGDDDSDDFLSSFFSDDIIAATTRLTVAPRANTCQAPTKTDHQKLVISAKHESDKKHTISDLDCLNTDKTTHSHKTTMEVKADSKPVVKRSDSEIDWCVICMDSFTDPKILDKCSHKFCQECINEYFKVRPQCPVCFVVYGVITGNQPKSGKMDHHIDHRLKLPGYEKYKTIVLYYNFPDGVQTEEHPYPGQEYYGTSRTAYLPNNDEGQKVHQLLKEAFKRRLVFTVGRSRTTGCDNQVTWNDIHHKTSPHGGQQGFGYPDPTYLSRVQEELAAFGVTEESIKENT